MAQIAKLPPQGRLIVDSGGVLSLSGGGGDARAALERARRSGFGVVIPTPVVAETHRGGRTRARTDRVFRAVDALLPTSVEIARLAGELMASARTSDAVDAIVVAEALASIPAVIVTSDADDIRRLLDGQPGRERVAVVLVD